MVVVGNENEIQSLSLRILGTEAIQKQLSQDVTDLITESEARGYKPTSLIVGNTFLQVGVVRSTIEDLHIQNWDTELNNNYMLYRQIFEVKYRQLLNSCETKNGVLGIEKNIEIYYSPEEPYMSLIAVDPTSKAKEDELKTADGFPYLVFKLNPDDVLMNFTNFLL